MVIFCDKWVTGLPWFVTILTKKCLFFIFEGFPFSRAPYPEAYIDTVGRCQRCIVDLKGEKERTNVF